MKKLWLLVLFMYNLNFAQTEFNKFLNLVTSKPINQRQALVDSFWNEAKKNGIPYKEKDYAVFLYRSKDNLTIKVAGDFTEWSPSSSNFNLIEGTDLYYSVYRFTETARLDYKLIINGNWILDPNNPYYCYGGFGPNSELAMPKYIRPWEINTYANTKKGTLQTFTIASTNTGKTYTCRIYLPFDYSSNTNKYYPTVYINDGDEYINLAQSKNILDNLIDSSLIPSVIAVFVVPTNRNDEYAFAFKEKYSKFIIDELVSYIDNNYRTIKSPGKRAIVGTSLGGNISGYISFNYPDKFGLSGWHSPAFWVNNKEVVNLYTKNPKKDIKIYTVYGTYEGNSISGIIPQMVDSLKKKGYQIGASVYDEGHSWGLWKATLDEILIYLFNDNTTNIKQDNYKKKAKNKVEIYPNPSNPNFNIKFIIDKKSKVNAKLYSIDGKLLKDLFDKEFMPGENIETISLNELPNGVYILNIEFDKNTIDAQKIILLK